VALEQLTARIPNLRLAGASPTTEGRGNFFERHLASLPVEWNVPESETATENVVIGA
jgi:hypothetical protein